MRARSDESLMNSYVSLAALGCDGAFSGAVVATDTASANADYDNGAGLLHWSGHRRGDERATRRVGVRRGRSGLLPGRVPLSSGAALLHKQGGDEFPAEVGDNAAPDRVMREPSAPEPVS